MRFRGTYLPAVLGSMLVAQALGAQQSARVTGRAFDEDHLRRPGIASVRVLLVAAQDSSVRVAVLSNEEGHFLIDQLVPGRYSISMSRIGYATMRWERDFNRAGDTLTVGMRPANGGDGPCATDTVLAPGFGVRVRDQNAQPVLDGITIVARGSSSVDTLRLSNGVYGGTPRREGTYVLEVTGLDFRPARSHPFDVRKVPPTSASLCGIATPGFLFVERVGVSRP